MDKTSIRRSRTATHLNKQRHNFLAHQCAAPGGRTDSPGGGKGDRKGTLHGGATPWKHRVRRSGGQGRGRLAHHGPGHARGLGGLRNTMAQEEKEKAMGSARFRGPGHDIHTPPRPRKQGGRAEG
ncbi:unnamed protein product [Prorocentrum cordatum]|uniref:Uncharacterized protein n=1 Tax=Prorocentrum cordatum TaxID=2364126 RepID=A0ABN9RAX0_9DINO|nr:unnamed protein product [Polarella glacialis]